MPKRKLPLTSREVKSLLKRPGFHSIGSNLYLQVSSPGIGSFVYRYKMAGRPRRDMGVGSANLYDLAEIHAKGREAGRLVASGVDPIEHRREKATAAALERAKSVTFKESAEAFIAANRSGWKNQVHARQWPVTLEKYVFPVLGDVPVQAVDVGLVMQAIEPIWNAKPETASRVRGRIESVLNWAAARGYREGQNPATWRGHLENLLPKKSRVRRAEHHVAMPYGELPDFIAELRKQEGVGARALEFAILTVARTGEVIGATWSEIDLAGRLWTIPAARMKAGRQHRTPLSEPAISILHAMAAVRQGGHVFPGVQPGHPINNKAMIGALRGLSTDATVHGFRSTFSDWCAEQTTFPSEVREMALAHAVGDKVEAAYRRGDLFEKRRELAEAWASFCAGESL